MFMLYCMFCLLNVALKFISLLLLFVSFGVVFVIKSSGGGGTATSAESARMEPQRRDDRGAEGLRSGEKVYPLPSGDGSGRGYAPPQNFFSSNFLVEMACSGAF